MAEKKKKSFVAMDTAKLNILSRVLPVEVKSLTMTFIKRG